MTRQRDDLAGQRFGRLLVIEYSHRSNNVAQWHCLCDCGTETVVGLSQLRSGKTRSCGCLRRDVTTARNTKHGLKPRQGRTVTYYSWANMIRRTTSPDHPRYADWGGRGIKVCDRWRDYANFLADMGEKPPGMTLDRIDNDGDYETVNCRWATHHEQMSHKRDTKLTIQKVMEIEQLHAQSMPIAAIAKAVGMGRHTVGTVCTVLVALSSRR